MQIKPLTWQKSYIKIFALRHRKAVGSGNFQKTVFPLFSTKCLTSDKLLPGDKENNKCVSYDDELCQIFCSYFYNTISGLEVPNISENTSEVAGITDSVFAVINMFQDHPTNKNTREKDFKSVVCLTY